MQLICQNVIYWQQAGRLHSVLFELIRQHQEHAGAKLLYKQTCRPVMSTAWGQFVENAKQDLLSQTES